MNTQSSRLKLFGLMTCSFVLLGTGVMLTRPPVVEADRKVPSTPLPTSTAQPVGQVEPTNEPVYRSETERNVPSTVRPQVSGSPAPDDNLRSGSTAPQAATQAFSYYMVAGAAFRGKSSTTTYAYDVRGCIHAVSAADQLNAEIHLPQGAVIKYLRIYYIDTNASAGLTAFLTRYTPGQLSQDLISMNNSTVSGGAGFTDSNEITETVDNANYAYSFIAAPTINDSTVQICGMRLAYYAPLFPVVALPLVTSNATSP